MEREVPVFVIIDSQVGVQIRIDGSSVVTKPHVGAVVCQKTSRSFVGWAKEPGASDVDKAMLEEDWSLEGLTFRTPNMPQIKNISILASNIELLKI